ncbi:putative enzyme related to lactoylglutathione lyase [Chitinophaga sp. W3I9]|uniref:VOC family protein n=2 Tax=unclassified Chitinophaga TaxID=2619133 RepID=UPI003D1B950C
MEQAAVRGFNAFILHLKKSVIMFGKTKAFSSFSVNDLQQAKNFYQETLGIEVVSAGKEPVITLKIAGIPSVWIYEKPDHTPATFTVLNFQVSNVEEAVDQLTAKGVKFQQYEGELKTDEKGIFRGGGPVIAWFADPAGNILSVVEEG